MFRSLKKLEIDHFTDDMTNCNMHLLDAGRTV